MSDNILFLRARSSGNRIALAKFFFGQGWRVIADNLTANLDAFFGEEQELPHEFELEYDVEVTGAPRGEVNWKRLADALARDLRDMTDSHGAVLPESVDSYREYMDALAKEVR